MKNTSVPAVNLPQSSVETPKLLDEQIDEKRIRIKNRLKNINLNTEKEEITCDCFLDEEAKYEIEAPAPNNFIPDETVALEEKSKSGDLLGNCFLDYLKTDKELSTAIGIQSFEMFDSIAAAVQKTALVS